MGRSDRQVPWRNNSENTQQMIKNNLAAAFEQASGKRRGPMILFRKIHALAGLAPLLLLQSAFAAHPLVTDDTGTQDVGNQQLEANTDWSRQKGVASHVADFAYTYGLLTNVDVFGELPVTASSPHGVNDASLGVKWRFYESGPSSFAIKPVLVLPTGNQHEGLGSGRSGMALTLIGAYDAAPWAFYGNLGIDVKRYALAEDREENRGTLWRASAAVAYNLNQQWRAVADIGIARNPDVASAINPAYILAGVIYSPSKHVDLDAGIKFGLNSAEVDHQAGVGVTWHF